MKLTEYQQDRVSSYCFALSQICVASLVLKFFEPEIIGGFNFGHLNIASLVLGLTLTIGFAYFWIVV